MTSLVCDEVALAAVRSFLRADSREEVAVLLQQAVTALGGTVVPCREDRPDVLAVDVALGAGEPRHVGVPDRGARVRLDAALPALVSDALEAAARCDRHARDAWRASVDELTGVASRREVMSRLRAARPGDVVCLLDLDHFRELNETLGHAGGDDALRGFGRVLRGSTRSDDVVGRYGGDEFVMIVRRTGLPVTVRRLQDVAAQWAAGPSSRPTFSGGIACVDERGGLVALDAADRALYRAKRRGRGLIETATLSSVQLQAQR